LQFTSDGLVITLGRYIRRWLVIPGECCGQGGAVDPLVTGARRPRSEALLRSAIRAKRQQQQISDLL
jgi:hypothetical protein